MPSWTLTAALLLAGCSNDPVEPTPPPAAAVPAPVPEAAVEPPAAPSAAARLRHWYLQKKQVEVHSTWSYTGETGPAHWADLSPDYALARTGTRQSPIDLPSTGLPETELPDIELDYKPERAVFVNNGHTLHHDETPGNTLRIAGESYSLEQFHFHAPSEHTIDGEHAPLEMHLVHENEAGELLVVGLLFEASPDAPDLAGLGLLLPDDAGESGRIMGMVNPADYMTNLHPYTRYEGSLTTPPCTEGVTWILPRERATVRPRLLKRLQGILDHNNRPTQPLNDRPLKRG
jgi:carbonic anhydrase